MFCGQGKETGSILLGQTWHIFLIYGVTFVCVFRANNRIGSVSVEQLVPFGALQTLDLSNNNLVEIKSSFFPALPLKNLYVSWC